MAEKFNLYRLEIFDFAFITILVTRVWLWILEHGNIQQSVIIGGIRWHHFYTGFVIIAIGAIVAKRKLPRALFLGTGSGLVVDELTLPFYLSGYNNLTYWAMPSLLATLVGLAALYFFSRRNQKR